MIGRRIHWQSLTISEAHGPAAELVRDCSDDENPWLELSRDTPRNETAPEAEKEFSIDLSLVKTNHQAENCLTEAVCTEEQAEECHSF